MWISCICPKVNKTNKTSHLKTDIKGQMPELNTGMLAEDFVFPISVLVLPKTVCC